MEKILARQINENIEATMPINIFGYRPGKSTSEAVEWLMSRKSEKSPNVLVMTDAKNAFASLDHSLLLGMFECFGATNHVTKLMEQFLKRRSQFVQIGDEKSAKWSPDSGIYAGSVLSGVLFNIGTASQVITRPHMSKFADDSGAKVEEPKGVVKWEQAVKNELLDQLRWYSRANLSPAIEKTEILPLGVSMDELEIGGTKIKPSTSIRFLGVTLQANRRFDLMVSEKVEKLRKVAWKIRSLWVLSKEQKIVVYKALVHGLIFNNGGIYLPWIPRVLHTKLQVAANSCLRAALNLPYKGEVDLSRYRKRWSLPTVEQILIYLTVKEAFKNSVQMQHELDKQKLNESMITRQNDQLKAAPGLDRFKLAQIKAWNMLSPSQKGAKHFPKVAIWRSILRKEFQVYK